MAVKKEKQVSVRYYCIKFQYPGKRIACAGSADFVLPAGAPYHEMLGEAKKVAKESLMKFFSNIFPDEALPFLKDPEIVELVEGAVMMVPEGMSDA